MVFTGCSDEPENNSNKNTINVSSNDGELTVNENANSVTSQEEANALFNQLFDAASGAVEQGVDQSGIISDGTSEVVEMRSATSSSEEIAETVNGLSGLITVSGKATFVESDTYETITANAKATFYDFSEDNSLYIGGSIGLKLSLTATEETYTGYVQLGTALRFSDDEFTGSLEFNAKAKIDDKIDVGYQITSATAKIDGYTIPSDLVNSKLDYFIDTFEAGSVTEETPEEIITINQ